MKGHKKALWIILGAVAFVLAIAAIKFSKPVPPSYSFITVDHPIDMWQDGNDQWAYYMNESQSTVAEQASLARKTLSDQGFTEDKSRMPWICFVKGANEVVICNHNEFAVNGSLKGSKLVQTKAATPAGSGGQWPCILVKNGPGRRVPIVVFQIIKLIHRW
jgi:hypothetical protein